MNVMKNLKLLLLAFVVGLASCGDDDSAVVPLKTTFTFDVALNTTASSFLDFQSGFMVLREIVWDGTLAGSATKTSVTQSQITTFDIATGLATPASPVVDIAPGVYSNIAMGLELQDNGVDPNTVLIGEFTASDGSKTPIKFIFDSGEVFEATLTNLTIVQGSNHKCTLMVDPMKWFASVTQAELEDATLDGSGMIVLSESVNTATYDKVETAILNTIDTNATISCQ